jgi:hypothetical protein
MSASFQATGGSHLSSDVAGDSREQGITRQEIWPTFFVVGAQKCGTTTLYEQLSKHGEVFVPANKEPDFFTSVPERSQVVHKFSQIDCLEDYQEQFREAASFKAIGDFSTGYLWDPAVAAKIRGCNPKARIVIMLRDPVMRANSAYLMFYSRGRDTAPSLREAIERDADRKKDNWFTAFHYIDGGLYYEQVKRYLDTFGREQVLIVLFEDLLRKPLELFTAVASHIGISAAPFASMDLSEAYNAFSAPRAKLITKVKNNRLLSSMGRSILPESLRKSLRRAPWLFSNKKPALDNDTRKHLQEVFRADLARLEQLLGRALPELRSQWI